MEITREYLSQRISELSAQEDQALANANACRGAIMALTEALAHLDKAEERE